jgi:hypothetical protein
MRSVAFWLLIALLGLVCLAGCVKPPATLPVAQDAPPSPPPSPAPEPPMENLEVTEPAPGMIAEAQNAVAVDEPAILPAAEPTPPATEPEAGSAPGEPVVVERPAPSSPAPRRRATSASSERHRERSSSRTSLPDDGPRASSKSGQLREVESKPWGTGGKYPWASEVKVTPEMMKSMSNEELSKAAMEIRARRGASFDDPKWQKYFDKQDWYYKGQMYGSGRLSETEAKNLEAIRSYQQREYGRAWKPSGE